MRIAVAQRHAVEAPGAVRGAASVTGELGDDRATTTVRSELAAGDTLTLTKYVAYHTAGQTTDSALVTVKGVTAGSNSVRPDAVMSMGNGI